MQCMSDPQIKNLFPLGFPGSRRYVQYAGFSGSMCRGPGARGPGGKGALIDEWISEPTTAAQHHVLFSVSHCLTGLVLCQFALFIV